MKDMLESTGFLSQTIMDACDFGDSYHIKDLEALCQSEDAQAKIKDALENMKVELTQPTKSAIIIMGAPGSGKSTHAKTVMDLHLADEATIHLERDELRYNLMASDSEFKSKINHADRAKFFGDFHTNYYKLDHEFREMVENHITEIYEETIDSGEYPHIVISDTQINRKNRNRLFSRLKQNGYEIHVRILNPDLKVLLQRNETRSKKVSTSIIVDFWHRLQHQLPGLYNLNVKSIYTLSGKYNNDMVHTEATYNQHSDKVVICDLDGTLAHADLSKRSWYEGDVTSDDFDKTVWSMVKGVLADTDADLVFITGRNSKMWQNSMKWIETHTGFKYGSDFQLYSRGLNDNSKDTIVKNKIFNTFIKDKYSEVVCVFDDRPSVVNLWNDLGLKTIACADQRIVY